MECRDDAVRVDVRRPIQRRIEGSGETALPAERLHEVARTHWDVENALHWRLDVVMNEDRDRTRLGHGPNNLAILRHMAITIMQKEGMQKEGMQKEGSKEPLKGKFQRAGWNNADLARSIGPYRFAMAL